MKIYTFKITNKRDKKNTKIVEAPGNMKLEVFAKKIIESFGFDFDHMFAFSSNLTNPYGPAEKLFEAFVDYGDEATEGAKSVKLFMISDAFEKIGDKMLYLFDYGDGWKFIVEVIEEKTVMRTSKNMFVLRDSTGDDPEQYPDYDEEE